MIRVEVCNAYQVNIIISGKVITFFNGAVGWVDVRKPNEYQASPVALGFVPQPNLQKVKTIKK